MFQFHPHSIHRFGYLFLHLSIPAIRRVLSPFLPDIPHLLFQPQSSSQLSLPPFLRYVFRPLSISHIIDRPFLLLLFPAFPFPPQVHFIHICLRCFLLRIIPRSRLRRPVLVSVFSRSRGQDDFNPLPPTPQRSRWHHHEQ